MRPPRWARMVAPASVVVACGGEQHLVGWRRGKLVLHHHRLPAEEALVAFGAPVPPCIEVVRSFRARAAWEDALFPRGPGLHEQHRRPPLPVALHRALEAGVVRGWERRTAAGGGARTALERLVAMRAEAPLMSALRLSMRDAASGPLRRVEVSIGAPHVRGSLDAREAWVELRLPPHWYRRVALAGMALYDRRVFVVDVVERVERDRYRIEALAWHPSAGGRWTAHVGPMTVDAGPPRGVSP